MTGKKVFIIGPGFIGWNVLDLLIAENYTVTGLVRRESHASQITSSGATAILGDLNDHTKISDTTADHDIIIHTATADDLPSVKAILEGIQTRATRGQSTIYIHTSGTSVLEDAACGSHKTDNIYHDNVRAEIDSVPDSALHRGVDNTIVDFQNTLGPKAKLAIMIPPLIYGFNPAHERLTTQIPTLTRFALKHGYAGYVGKGLSVESNIHVMDLARAYVVLLHHLEGSTEAETLENPYFFCENSGDHEPSWFDVAAAIGEGLFRAGKIMSAEPREISEELYGDLFGDFTPGIIGLNSRSRAVRLRDLGWKPREMDWRTSFITDELPEILREEMGEFKGYQVSGSQFLVPGKK